MKRIILIILICAFPLYYVMAERIAIAPLHILNEQEGTTKKENTSHQDVTNALKLLDRANVLGFEAVNLAEINPPVSLLDAVRLGKEIGSEYLIYGYIKTNDYSWSIELKFLDVASSQVKRIFYAADDITNYDRMIADVTNKIVLYIMDEYHVSIDGMSIEKREMVFNLPCNIGYWTYTSGDWTEVISGTGSLSVGFEFVPTDKLFSFRGDVCFMSVGLMLNYRYGMGNPAQYKANLHSGTVELPIILYRQWHPRSTYFVGIVPVYTMDFMSYTPRNADKISEVDSTMGFKFRPGIRFRAAQKIDLSFTADVVMRFYEPLQVSLEPSVGIVYNLSRREWGK